MCESSVRKIYFAWQILDGVPCHGDITPPQPLLAAFRRKRCFPLPVRITGWVEDGQGEERGTRGLQEGDCWPRSVLVSCIECRRPAGCAMVVYWTGGQVLSVALFLYSILLFSFRYCICFYLQDLQIYFYCYYCFVIINRKFISLQLVFNFRMGFRFLVYLSLLYFMFDCNSGYGWTRKHYSSCGLIYFKIF